MHDRIVVVMMNQMQIYRVASGWGVRFQGQQRYGMLSSSGKVSSDSWESNPSMCNLLPITWDSPSDITKQWWLWLRSSVSATLHIHQTQIKENSSTAKSGSASFRNDTRYHRIELHAKFASYPLFLFSFDSIIEFWPPRHENCATILKTEISLQTCLVMILLRNTPAHQAPLQTRARSEPCVTYFPVKYRYYMMNVLTHLKISKSDISNKTRSSRFSSPSWLYYEGHSSL